MKTCAVILGVLVGLAAADGQNLLKPTNKVESWRFEQIEGGKGSLAVDGEAITFTVTEVDGTDWHVQAVQTDLDLKEDAEYTLAFHIKASESRTVNVNAMIDQDDWHQIGLSETISIDKEFTPHEFTFRATGTVAKKNRISITLGDAKGTVTVKGLSLTAK